MNLDSEYNRTMVANKNRLFLLTMVKNSVKFLANLVNPRRYIIDSLFGVREIMRHPLEIEAILKQKGLAYEIFSLEDVCALGGGWDGSLSRDQKLVFVVHKP